MNKIAALLFLSILLIGTACKKEFKHTTTIDPNNDTACHLCNYADSLVGTYRGLKSYEPWEPAHDTVNFELEHVFMSFGNHIDSTIMFFHLIKEPGSSGGTEKFTVSLNNHNGIFYDTPIGDKLTIIGDSLHYANFFVSGEDTVIVYKFDGKKIP